jgi:hypothetical protein
MADVRVVPNFALSDGTTPSQIAAVDASGRVSVNLTASSATVTVDSELSTAAALADNMANPTAGGVGAFSMVWDSATWDRLPGNSTDGALVNLGANNDVTVTSGSITADTELSVAAALTDNFANPTAGGVGAFGMLFDGTNWDRAPGTSLGGSYVAGGIASDSPITGSGVNPVLIGGRASTAVPTAVSTDGDAVNAWLDLRGAQKIVMVDDAGDSAMDGTNNALRVNIVAGAAGGVTHTDDAAFAPTTDDGVPAFFFADEAATDPVDEGDAGIARMDVNRRQLVRIVGATDANRMDIDASGRPTVNVNGTVTVDTELPTAAAISAENTAAPTAPSVYGFGLVFDGTNWDRMPGTSVDGTLVNLGTNNDVTVTSGSITADTEFPAAAALADAESAATAVPTGGARLMGYNGTTWDRVRTANTGRLQVDVITGGGSDTPTNPINNYDTTATVAAGSTDNHDTVDFGAATKKVSQIIMGASVPLKGELQYVDNAVGTTFGVFFTPAGTSQSFKPPHRNFWAHTFTANAGFDGFRLIRTNLDASEAADVYSVILYED